jgi:hypothetical protein
MDEFELLNKIIKIKQTSSRLEVYIKLWHEGPEKQQFIADKATADAQIIELTQALEDVPEKNLSNNAKYQVIDQMRAYINQVSKVNTLLKISRNQSMVLENSFFIFLSQDIRNIIHGKLFGLRIPSDIYYTDIAEDGIEIEDLIAFLNNEIEILRHLNPVNFVTLLNYYQDFENRLIAAFIH